MYFIIIISIIVLDQWTKYLAETNLKPITTYPIIENVFHLTYRRNTGAAFSIFRDRQSFLIILTSIVIVILIVYFISLLKNEKLVLLRLPLAFIIGGAIGNLIDRIRLNYVVDFFDFNLINFAVFNIADIFIVVGSIIFGYVVIFKNVEL